MAINAKAWWHRLCEGAEAFMRGQDLPSHAGVKAPWWRRAGWFLISVTHSFTDNRCPVRASALAYTTLLALVPMLAVAIGVSTSLLKTQEGQIQVKEMVDKFVAAMAPQLDLQVKSTEDSRKEATPDATPQAASKSNRHEVAEKIFGFINNIQSGTLGATGVVGLIIIAISLLSTIEATFNDIWGVARGRSWILRVVYYWAAITLGPLILIVAIGLTTSEQFEASKQWVSTFPLVGRFLVAQGMSLLPYVVLSVAFWGFYLVMPNTRVQWQSALVGGLVGGCLWQLNNQFNVLYVSKVVTYSKIYGSFALLPVFLIGLYFSWLILLLGAQVAYSYQHREAYLQSRMTLNIDQQAREFIALRLMSCIALQFQTGEKPWTAQALALQLETPSILTQQILQNLVQSGLLVESKDLEPAYALARSLRQITCGQVLGAMRQGSGDGLPSGQEPSFDATQRAFESIVKAEQKAAAEIHLESLVPSVSLQSQTSPPLDPISPPRLE
jgi:membrane protein